jgi:UDP-N-acetylmuramate-alanine ligase
MAHKSGIDPQKIIKAIASFKGLKRRLEKRFDGDITVFDDIAHSPEKASFVLENLRSIYTGKIYTIFEPNIGGRQKASAHMYDNAFKDADVVVIPRLTKLKVASNISEISESEIPLEANELTQIISKTHKNVVQFDEDDVLVQFLKQNTKKGDVIAFLGSHGFRGMIEETISNIQYPISHS